MKSCDPNKQKEYSVVRLSSKLRRWREGNGAPQATAHSEMWNNPSMQQPSEVSASAIQNGVLNKVLSLPFSHIHSTAKIFNDKIPTYYHLAFQFKTKLHTLL